MQHSCEYEYTLSSPSCFRKTPGKVLGKTGQSYVNPIDADVDIFSSRVHSSKKKRKMKRKKKKYLTLMNYTLSLLGFSAMSRVTSSACHHVCSLYPTPLPSNPAPRGLSITLFMNPPCRHSPMRDTSLAQSYRFVYCKLLLSIQINYDDYYQWSIIRTQYCLYGHCYSNYYYCYYYYYWVVSVVIGCTVLLFKNST